MDNFIEVDYFRYEKYGMRTCGDIFLQKKLKDQNRIVCVLSDGLSKRV